jgi:hypothetical protein
MARRAGGKAANRKARQRNVPRALRTAPAPTAVPPVGTPDAREAISLDPPRRTLASGTAAGPSALSGRDRAEYHYVERDLRNIGILTAILFALLIGAWFVTSAIRGFG